MTAREANEPEDWSEWAALYALGSLTAEERARCERRWHSDASFRAEVERLRAIGDALHLAAPAVAAPAQLFERVRARALGQEPAPQAAETPQLWKAWTAEDAGARQFGYLAGDASGWEATSIPGIEVRRLFADPAGDRVSMLVRMAKGTSYPAHVHNGPEECYVLAGDLHVGAGLHMRAGDYQRVEKGSLHPAQTTDEGCTLFISSSMSDELVLGLQA